MLSEGFRITSDHEDNQEDQSLTDADRGKIRQTLCESATSRNQSFNVDSGSGGTDESAQNISPFRAVIKSPAEELRQDAQHNESSGKGEDS
jgi:hypothetical protein